MRLEDGITYKTIRNIDISNIAKRLSELPEAIWHLTKPNEKIDAENSTKVRPLDDHVTRIWIRCTEDDWVPYHFKRMTGTNRELTESQYAVYAKSFKNNQVDDLLSSYTNVIVDELEKEFNGYAGRVLYARMAPNKKISPHIDPGYYLGVVHRFHVPIITNDNVKFTIDNTVFNMKTGVLYEIDNKLMHGVENLGDSERIHLIIDIIPKDKFPS